MAISFLGIKDPVGFGTSSASNHKPVKNNPDDVSIVQDSLNQIPASKGGPSQKLTANGKIVGGASDPTVRAIRNFQRFHFGFEDGVVDPATRPKKPTNSWPAVAVAVAAVVAAAESSRARAVS